ncbi:MAG: LysR family transcriptional regulator [Rhodobacteraceae bacterium]|nr:LysR family transcriptional regulator [Paracoccaceae bacterium]
MRYAQLRAFHHVARSGGFTLAAAAMNLTQPAVSDQVGQLEREHDVLLFRRQGRQIALTDAGEALYALTRQFFDVEDRIAELLTASRASVKGELRLVVDSAYHINAVLSRFRRAHPKVTITLHTGNSAHVLAELRDYRADIGVIGAMSEEPDLDVVALASSPIVAFASRDFAASLALPLNLADLTRLPFVCREEGSQTRKILEQELSRRGLTLTPAITAQGREAVRDIVAAGAGVGVTAMAEFRGDDRLVSLPLSDCAPRMPESLVCLSRRRDVRAIRAFMDTAARAEDTTGSR